MSTKWRGLSLQLQDHGAKGFKRWWVVAMPKRGNQKGRYFAHLGYWYHYRNKGHQRQINLNLARIIDFLAVGARPTKRLQYFFSLFGLMPRPFVPPQNSGYKTTKHIPKKDQQYNKKLLTAQRRRKAKIQNPVQEHISQSYYYRPLKVQYQWLKQRLIDIAYQNQQIRKILLADFQNSSVQKVSQLKGQEKQSQQPNIKITKLQKLQKQLAFLKSSSSFHPFIHGPLVRQINRLMPDVHNYKLQINKGNLRQSLARQRAKRMLSNLKKDYQQFLNMQDQLTKSQAINLILILDAEIASRDDKNIKMQDIKNFKVKNLSSNKKINQKLEYQLNQLYLQNKYATQYQIKQLFLKHLQQQTINFNRNFNYISYIKKKFRAGQTIQMQTRFPVQPRPDLKTHQPQEYFDLPKATNITGRFNRPFIPACDQDRTFLK